MGVAVRVVLSGQEDEQHSRSCRKIRKRINRGGTAACVAVLLFMMVLVAYPAATGVGEILRNVGSEYSHVQDYHIMALVDNNLRQPDRSHPHPLIALDAGRKGVCE